jgi:hypothetical protein
MLPRGLRHSLRIARIESTRSQRQFERSSTARALIAIVVGALAVGGGIAAYIFGTMFRAGQVTLPLETLTLAVTGGFLVMLAGFVQQTSTLVERIETNHLLTTVSARTVVLGVVITIPYRTAVRIAPATISVSVGFAVGIESPASALSIIIAVAGLFALTALVGACLSFVIEFITTRSPRFRRYKNIFVVLAFVLAFAGWTAASAELVSVTLVRDCISAAPTAWFVDLGLLGVPESDSNVLRGVGALALFAVGTPVLIVLTARIAGRVWKTESVRAEHLHRSRSLVGEGSAEQLFAGRVSRPVLTVARKRWLQERRIPRALMLPGYLIILLLGVLFPIFAAGEVPGISLVTLVWICAAATGLGFGLGPIETEYSSLPMTLTSVTGEQFVRGTTLAGVAIGAPITVIMTSLLAIGSPIGILETLLIAFMGIVLCICSVTLAATIGMSVSYRDLLPAPLPFTSATIYAEIGRAGFIKMGVMLGILVLVSLPMLGGYLFAFFASGTTGLAVPISVVRVGLLSLTIILASGVSIVTYQRAVRRFDRYMLS